MNKFYSWREGDEEAEPPASLAKTILGDGGSRTLIDIPLSPLGPGEFRLRVDGVLGEMARPDIRMAVNIRLHHSARVSTVKRKLQEVCGMSPYVQRLYHEGHVLDDELELVSIGLPKLLMAERLPYDAEAGARLLQAAKDGDLAAAKLAVETQADPNFPNPEDRDLSPLHAAAANKTKGVEVLTFLLELGARIERVMEGNMTALHLAAKSGSAEAAERLLEFKAMLDRRSDDDWAAIHYAADSGNAHCVKVLLEARADALEEVKRWTPLHFASRRGHEKVAELLMQNGADCNMATGDESPICPFHLGAASGKADFVKLMFKASASPLQAIDGGWCPLHIAALLGKKDLIKLLVKGRADPQKVMSADGVTALHLAAAARKEEIVRLLLKNHAKPEVCMKGEVSPLHMACCSGLLDSTKALLRASAFVDKARDCDKQTPLLIAIENGHTKLSEELIKAEASLDKKDDYGRAPLHVAAELGDVDAVNMLCKAGANVDLALDDGRKKPARCTPTDGWTALFLATRGGHEKVVTALLKQGALVNRCGNDGRSPLHETASKGNVGLCKQLLQAKASVKATMRGGWTPLHAAAHQGHLQVTQLLSKAGAELEAETADGWTPLFMAAHGGREEMVEHLKAAGASKEAAMSAAERTRHEQVIKQVTELLEDR